LRLGKVFARSDLQSGTQWTVTASHELLEMLGDPEINLTVFVQPDPQTQSGAFVCVRVFDACEADQFGYQIGGTLVSDFVFPAWFESFRSQGSAQFDQGNQISKPFDLLPGGYIGVFDVTAGTGWQQITVRGELRYDMRPRLGSRRERRRLLRSHWLRSAAPHEIRARAEMYIRTEKPAAKRGEAARRG
jgi:hypothetical protein